MRLRFRKREMLAGLAIYCCAAVITRMMRRKRNIWSSALEDENSSVS